MFKSVNKTHPLNVFHHVQAQDKLKSKTSQTHNTNRNRNLSNITNYRERIEMTPTDQKSQVLPDAKTKWICFRPKKYPLYETNCYRRNAARKTKCGCGVKRSSHSLRVINGEVELPPGLGLSQRQRQRLERVAAGHFWERWVRAIRLGK